MFVKKFISAMLVLLLLSACGMQSPMEMMKQIEQTQAALKKAGGAETVSLNVQNTKMFVVASDERFKSLPKSEREEVARRLAVTALEHWSTKWPISEVTVAVGYQDEQEAESSTFKFDPETLREANLQPTASGTPEAQATP